jgi:tripartite-type tricarboxylate transporter receptor subunit TctC
MQSTVSAMTRILCALAAAAWVGIGAAPAGAAGYPDKPVRIIVPSTPGGGFDFVGRVLADKLGAELGQNFIVENRAAAGTLVGTRAAAQAPADGYTLVVGGLSNIALNGPLYKDPGYSPTDFVPLGLAVSYSYTWIARPDLPQSNLKDVIDYARAHPNKLNLAIGGVGSGQQVGALILLHLTGVKMEQVNFKGAQPAYPDLMSGRVDLFYDNTTTARPYIDAGKVKALAISSAARNPLLPNVPTITESGVARFEMETWFGLFAPGKTPSPVVARLQAAVAKAIHDPKSQAVFEKSGGRVLDMTPAETAHFVTAEIAKWGDLVRRAGVKAE